jgi:hypothetical protein
MKLIRIDSCEFAIIDDSEIINGCIIATFAIGLNGHGRGWYTSKYTGDKISKLNVLAGGKRVTHSTSPIDESYLKLSEILELIGEVNIEKLASDYTNERNYLEEEEFGFYDGYTQALEDNKHKIYTLDNLRECISEAWLSREENDETFTKCMKRILKTFEPKLDWDVEIVDGKIKLI